MVYVANHQVIDGYLCFHYLYLLNAKLCFRNIHGNSRYVSFLLLHDSEYNELFNA